MSDDEAASCAAVDPPSKKAKNTWQIKSGCSVKQEEPSPSLNGASRPLPVLCSRMSAWQTQQMAKAVFDNTVNTMIENRNFPLPEMSQALEEYQTRRGVILEDEAVLMAIQSHGLRKPCPFSSDSDSGSGFRPQIITVPSMPSFPVRTGIDSSDEEDYISEAVSAAILSKGLGQS